MMQMPCNYSILKFDSFQGFFQNFYFSIYFDWAKRFIRFGSFLLSKNPRFLEFVSYWVDYRYQWIVRNLSKYLSIQIVICFGSLKIYNRKRGLLKNFISISEILIIINAGWALWNITLFRIINFQKLKKFETYKY